MAQPGSINLGFNRLKEKKKIQNPPSIQTLCSRGSSKRVKRTVVVEKQSKVKAFNRLKEKKNIHKTPFNSDTVFSNSRGEFK